MMADSAHPAPPAPRPRRMAWRLAAFGVRAAGAAAGLGLLTLIATVVAAQAHRATAADPVGPAGLIVVFGGDFRDGRCHIETDYRTSRALEIAATMPGAALLVTDRLEPTPDVMAANVAVLAHLRGLPPPARVLIEPRATSTFENVRFSRDLMGSDMPARVILVTDAVHMARARLLWRHFTGTWPDFALARAPGEAFSRARAKYHLREAAAWWLNLGKLAAWEGLGLIGLDDAQRGAVIR